MSFAIFAVAAARTIRKVLRFPQTAAEILLASHALRAITSLLPRREVRRCRAELPRKRFFKWRVRGSVLQNTAAFTCLPRAIRAAFALYLPCIRPVFALFRRYSAPRGTLPFATGLYCN